MSDNSSLDGKEAWLPLNKGFSTIAIHSGYSPGTPGNSAVVPPITMSTTYQLDPPAIDRGFEYSRTLNPNRKILEQKLAALEGAKYGICFSSGISAMASILSLLESGDHIVCSDDIYGGSSRLMRESIVRNKLEVDFVDLTQIKNLNSALKSNTKMIFFESPANPTLKVFDIALISKTSHDFKKDILVAVDNTLLTSFFQKPLDHGADLVHYSLTKYANGHADVIMGAVTTNHGNLNKKLCYYQNVFGGVPSPFDCYLVIRGLKTLHLRLEAFMKNSMEVARFLRDHSKVESVNHPGFQSHPQHKIALRQSSGHSGLLSFTIKDSSGSGVKFIEHLKVFCNAASYGACESLAELPAFLTHIMVPVEQRLRLGITNNFVRLSVGLESPADLIEDLRQALEKC